MNTEQTTIQQNSIENNFNIDRLANMNAVRATFQGMNRGERKELLLEVESEKIIDASHVEIKMRDGANRRFIWVGTTGSAARLKPKQVVLLKGTADNIDKFGIHLKHCRVLEVA